MKQKPKIGVQKQVSAPPASQQNIKPLPTKALYYIHQHYTVTADESTIDQEEEDHIFPGEWSASDISRWYANHAKRKAQMHRMFKAIMTDEHARDAVFEYAVVGEHDFLGEGTGLFVKEHYGRDTGFFDILLELAPHFAPEDREWLLRTKKAYDEQTGDDEEKFDLGTQVEDLEHCFQVKADGYHLGEHVQEKESTR